MSRRVHLGEGQREAPPWVEGWRIVGDEELAEANLAAVGQFDDGGVATATGEPAADCYGAVAAHLVPIETSRGQEAADEEPSFVCDEGGHAERSESTNGGQGDDECDARK